MKETDDTQRQQWRAETIHLLTGDGFNASQELQAIFARYGLESLGVSAVDYQAQSASGYQHAQELMKQKELAEIIGLLHGLSEALYARFYTPIED